jgi:WD40 repeat protein
MNACLNPRERHTYPEQQTNTLICPTPDCGFLLSGAVIGSWQITTLIGKKLSADTYLAEPIDPTATDQTQVVVKIIKKCIPHSFVRIQRLLTLQHPSIQTIQQLSWIEEEHAICVITHYERRGSLARFLKPETRLSLSAVLYIINQLAGALQFAHNQQIVHGALKPENCLIVAPDTIQIADCYEAFLTREINLTPTMYMAPEQTQLGVATPASDQYTLAIIACQLLCNYLAAAGVTPRNRSTNDMLTLLPQAVQNVLRQALHNQPMERFPQISMFAQALQDAVNQGQTNQTNTPPPDTARPFLEHLQSRSNSSLPNLPTLFQTQQRQASGPMTPLPPSFSPLTQNSGPLLPLPAANRTGAGMLCRLPGHTAAITRTRWAADGQYLATADSDENLRIWYIKQHIGTPLATLSSQGSGKVMALDWSPREHLLAVASEDAAIRIWHMSTQPTFDAYVEAAWWGHDGEITALEWSRTGVFIATTGKDRALRLWDRKGSTIASWQAHGRGGISAMSMSPDGSLIATGGSDREIHLWDVNGNRLNRYTRHTDEIRQISWSPDQQYIASWAGKKDPHIHIWHAHTGQTAIIIPSHTHEMTGIYWNNAVSRLLTTSTDQSLRFWDMTQSTAMQIGSAIPLESTPLSMDSHASTQRIAIGTSDMQVLIFQIHI